MRTQSTMLNTARPIDILQPHKVHKRRLSPTNLHGLFDPDMNRLLSVPSAPQRKASQRLLAPPAQIQLDEFLSSDVDVELELSFASTMSLNSPPRNSVDLSPENENPNYTPMDISPAPQRVMQSSSRSGNVEKQLFGRPRAFTSGARLFGRDMSNNASVTSLQSVAKSTETNNSSSKRLQRSVLPFEWIGASQNDNVNSFTQPQNLPPSPAASDAMDVDSSFVYVPSSDALDDCPCTAVPTIVAFDVDNNPLLSPAIPASAAPTVTTFNNLFYEVESPKHYAPESFQRFPTEEEMVQAAESPSQPYTKKRRSSSPPPNSLRRAQLHAPVEEPSFDSSPAGSSPVTRKLERMASGPLLKKPMLSGLGAPLELNANKKRPRRPALSAMVTPGEGPLSQPRSAHPLSNPGVGGKENEEKQQHQLRLQHVLPPVRRAFSAMLPASLAEQSLSSEEGLSSFDNEGPDMSSPAQAYAKRQQVKTIRRCDGTDDFRPITGATAMVSRDNEVMKRTLRRSEERQDRSSRQSLERDTPRSKYLNAGPNLGGFGDNEALGKILPCHRVREDGLMRITSTDLDDLLDGVYDSQLASFHIIDCRFDYEYNGGHIPGAININTTAGVEEFLLGANALKPLPSMSGDDGKKTVLVFHCEFSVKRAPTFAKHLRSKDRALNNHVYPKIHYPEVYILEGGYSQYYQSSAARCQPQGYVRMDDPHYAQSRKEDLDQFRKGKFGRTKSYAYGDSKMLSGISQQHQSKRNTAPSGGPNTLFAAANAARTRRGGLGSGTGAGASTGLHMLAEDGSPSHHSEDEETDIGDSPCPPPSKTVTYKGKKIGRLARAETYDAARMVVGY